MNITERISNWLRASSTDPLIFAAGEVTLKAGSDDKRPTVEVLAYSGGTMRVGGFGEVVLDLQGLDTSPSVTLLADHRASIEGVVGTAQPAIENNQLVARGTLTSATEAGRTLAQLGRDGVQLQASIGAEPLASRRVREGDTIQANGQNITAPRGGMLLVTRARLKEISVLPVGADDNSTASIAAQAQGNINMNFDQWLESNGWKRDTLSASQLSKLQAAYNTEHHGGGTATATSGGDDPVASERQRQAEIMRITARHPQLQDQAIRDNWTAQQTELEVLKASRPNIGSLYVNAGSNGASGASERDIASAAVMLMAGYEDAAAKIAEGRAVQAARDMQLTNLRDWNRFNATAAGDTDSMIRASFSNASLGVLMSSIPKMVMEEFQLAPASVDAIASWQPLSDFKEASIYRLLALRGGLEEIGQDGEIKHGALEEFDKRIKLGTYARMFAITRRMIINDDVSALASIPRVLVQEASRLRGEKFAELLAENPGNFFHDDNGNDITDELNFAGLDAAIVQLRTQTDQDGRALNLQPTTLLVHPAQEATAASLLESMELSRDGSNDNQPTGNPMRRRNLRLEVEPRLSTTTEWYLWSRPSDAAVVVGTLNGQRIPTVETSDADFDQLGSQVRGYYDVAVVLAEPRAAVKSDGTGST